MKFTLEIELGNDEMRTWGNIVAALRGLISKLNTHDEYTGRPKIDEGRIRDINGNTVGKWEILSDQPIDRIEKPFMVYERMDQATAAAKPEEYIVAFESIATGCVTYATTLDPASLGERKKPVVIMRKPLQPDPETEPEAYYVGASLDEIGKDEEDEGDDSDDPTSVLYEGHREDQEAVAKAMRRDSRNVYGAQPDMRSEPRTE